MTNKQHPKVRLVKCPRCAKILPEPEHVPLYTCGGCGTTLQAKNYISSNKEISFSSHAQHATRNNGVIHARDGGESSGSSRRSSSSGEHVSLQDKGRDQDAVQNSSSSEQNGDASPSDHISLSEESSLLKKNGQLDRKMHQFVLKDHNEKGDREAVQSCSYSELNGYANSGNHTAFSQEDQKEGKDWDAVKRFSKSAQSKAANHTHHTGLSEESRFMDKKESGEIHNEMGQLDSRDECANDYPTVLGNKEPVQLTMEKSKMKDDSAQVEQSNDHVIENHHEKKLGDVNHERDTFNLEELQVRRKKECEQLAVVRKSVEDEDDQHEQSQIGYGNSADTSLKYTAVPDHQIYEETRKLHLKQEQIEYVISAEETSLIESPAAKNLAEYDASEYDVSEETRTLYVASNPCQDKKYEQNQIEFVSSSKDTSSLTEFSALKKLTKLGSANSAECDASNHEVSKETRKAYLVGKHSHQDLLGDEIKCTHDDVLGNEIKCLDGEKPEIEKSGKGYGDGMGLNDFVECIVERLGSVKISSATAESTEINPGGNDNLVSGTEDGFEACETHSVNAPSNATDLIVSHEEGTTRVFGDPQHERTSLDNVKRTSKKKIKNFEESDVCINSEVGSLLPEISRSPTKWSSAYDGSVSSFDENEDQIPRKPVQLSKEILFSNNAAAGYDGAEESPDRNIIPPESIIYKNPRGQTEAKRSSSILLDGKLKSRMIEEEGPLEGNGFPQGNIRYRPNRDNFLPRVPYRRRSSEVAFETGSSSSSALHDEPPSHQMHHPYRRRVPEGPSYREKELFPMYYDCETSGEIYDKPKYHHAYFDRRRRAESWSMSRTLPRMPYSGEISYGRYSHVLQYPEDRRWSAQLPLPAVCCHQGGYMGQTWENRWDPYDSYPTSPQRFVESESSCAWGHDTISLSDDPRQKDQFMRRLYLREKRQAVKRKFHPIAGGAPFLTCNFCFNIVQLPEGFLLSRRRRRNQKLQCGACSRILEFSLENEGCLAPYETNVDKNVHLPVSSHVNHSRQSSLTSADGRELVSRDSFGASGRKESRHIPGNSKNGERVKGTHEAAPHTARGRESKVTWKMPARSKSPLHRLMGYSSPQDLLTGREDHDLE